MRHYFGYDIAGNLRTIEVYGPAGWPSNQCMEDPQCNEKSVTSLRESRAKDSPGIVDWVLFDCPCDAGQGALLKDCVCVNMKFAESYVDPQTKTMQAKPMRTVYVDDEIVTNHMGVVTRNPGTVVVLKVVSAGVSDGTKVKCTQKGMVDLSLDDEWDLTFTNGETDTKELIAPAQGTKGLVQLGGDFFRAISFCLRGFTTP